MFLSRWADKARRSYTVQYITLRYNHNVMDPMTYNKIKEKEKSKERANTKECLWETIGLLFFFYCYEHAVYPPSLSLCERWWFAGASWCSLAHSQKGKITERTYLHDVTGHNRLFSTSSMVPCCNKGFFSITQLDMEWAMGIAFTSKPLKNTSRTSWITFNWCEKSIRKYPSLLSGIPWWVFFRQINLPFSV